MTLLTVQTVPVIRSNVEVQNKNGNIHVVCHQNQVSVLGTETKVQFRYQGRFFFPKQKLFFIIFFSGFKFFLVLATY